MFMMVSFVLSFFPRDVLDEILNLIESVSEDFPSYFCISHGTLKKDTRALKLSDFFQNKSVLYVNEKATTKIYLMP